MKSSYNFCNKLFHGCGIAGMRLLDSGSVQQVVTSPPYGTMRDYGGHSFYFKSMANELWRVIKPGGIVCWHVQDQMTDGAESGESLRQCLYFLELGFRLPTNLTIEFSKYGKHSFRYGQPIQHVFVLSKGKPRVFSPIMDIPNDSAGRLHTYKEQLKKGIASRTVRINPFRKRGVHWSYSVGTHNTSDRVQHPALMPEILAHDLIRSWSKEGDLVLDPMSGGATTAKMAFLLNRRYLGFEINREYHDIAVARMQKTSEEAAKPKFNKRR